MNYTIFFEIHNISKGACSPELEFALAVAALGLIRRKGALSLAVHHHHLLLLLLLHHGVSHHAHACAATTCICIEIECLATHHVSAKLHSIGHLLHHASHWLLLIAHHAWLLLAHEATAAHHGVCHERVHARWHSAHHHGVVDLSHHVLCGTTHHHVGWHACVHSASLELRGDWLLLLLLLRCAECGRNDLDGSLADVCV